MQTLWSRVAHAKCTCKRPACFPNSTTFTRRKDAATLKCRMRSVDAFTVYCSSFLATAAVIDSKLKKDRRENWLRMIKEVKDDMRILEDEQRNRLSIRAADAADTRTSARNGQLTWVDIFKWADSEFATRHALGFENWKGVPLCALENLSEIEIEKALLNDTLLRKLMNRSWPSTSDQNDTTKPYLVSTKLRKIWEWSIAKLAYRLLLQPYRRKRGVQDQPAGPLETSQLSSGALSRLIKKCKEAERRVCQLRKHRVKKYNFEDFESPDAPRYSATRLIIPSKVAHLNASIWNIFDNHRCEGESVNSLVAKICYKLLISDAPPNAQTYTILIANLGRLGEKAMVKWIIDSMTECYIRVNTPLASTILDHYTNIGDYQGYSLFASKMDGWMGGLNLESQKVTITPATWCRYRFVSDPQQIANQNLNGTHEVTNGSVRIVQKATRDQNLYSAQFHGAMKLFGHRKAMVVYIDMIMDGLEPTVQILTTILQDCYNRRDLLSGFRAWEKFLKHVDKNGQEITRAEKIGVYLWVLRLCQTCGHNTSFWDVLRTGVDRNDLPKAIYDFPEQIRAMDADNLMGFTLEHVELLRRRKRNEICVEPFENLLRWLGTLSHKLIQAARALGCIEESLGLIPAFGYLSAAKMKLEREDLLKWCVVMRPELAVQHRHMIMPWGGHIPTTCHRAPEIVHRVAAEKEVCENDRHGNMLLGKELYGKKLRQSEACWTRANRTNYSTNILILWLQMLGHAMASTAQRLGEVELFFRHAPTVGHMLSVKIKLLAHKSISRHGSTIHQPPKNSAFKRIELEESAALKVRLLRKIFRKFKATKAQIAPQNYRQSPLAQGTDDGLGLDQTATSSHSKNSLPSISAERDKRSSLQEHTTALSKPRTPCGTFLWGFKEQLNLIPA